VSGSRPWARLLRGKYQHQSLHESVIEPSRGLPFLVGQRHTRNTTSLKARDVLGQRSRSYWSIPADGGPSRLQARTPVGRPLSFLGEGEAATPAASRLPRCERRAPAETAPCARRARRGSPPATTCREPRRGYRVSRRAAPLGRALRFGRRRRDRVDEMVQCRRVVRSGRQADPCGPRRVHEPAFVNDGIARDGGRRQEGLVVRRVRDRHAQVLRRQSGSVHLGTQPEGVSEVRDPHRAGDPAAQLGARPDE
jgi:hypothetical protein